MTHSVVSNRHNGALGSSRPSDVVISADGSRIYTSGPDGAVRVYHGDTGELLATWQVGTGLGGIDLSPDGQFLLVLEAEPVSSSYSWNWTDNRFIVAVHKVDTGTGAVTTFLHQSSGYEWAFHDVAIMANGTALLTQKALPGWSAWPVPDILNTTTGVFTAASISLRHNSILSDSATGQSALIGEYNTSDAPVRIYTSGAGFTAHHSGYRDNVSGFNYGVQALSSSGLVAQHVPGNGLHIYDPGLVYQRNLSVLHPALVDNVAGLAFDSTGAFLFVLDIDSDLIVQLSTSDWSVVRSIPVGADVASHVGDFGSRLIVGPNMRYFTVVTNSGLLQIDNPNVSATLTGTAGNDALVGTGLHDVLEGLAGNDNLKGAAGNDNILGGDGDDRLDGGTGDDSMTGGIGNDIYFVDSAADTVVENAGEGTDEIRTTLASYSLVGTNVENLRASSNVPHDFHGNAADNMIIGGAGNDKLSGGQGNDRIAGGAGADELSGDQGDDVFLVDSGDSVFESAGNGHDTVIAASSFTLTPGSHVETLGTIDAQGTDPINLTGNEFQNLIYGNAGNNVLASGPRSGIGDHLNGNAGDDIYFVHDNDLVFEHAGNGHDTVIVIPYAGNATYALRAGSHVETLGTIDAQGTDRINLAGNEFQNLIYGNNGRNILTSNGGGDHLNGYGGDDIYFVSAGDLVFESAGNGHDTVNSSTSYALTAGSHVETLGTVDAQATTAIDLTGNEFQNLIYGNEGRNVLTSGGGGDHLNGYGGDDIYFVSTGDLVFEGSGRGYDTVNANSNYTLNGGSHVEVLGTVDAQATTAINLTGNELHNLIYGNEGNNVLTGGGGGDHLHGRGGNDILVEGVGADFLVGGAGADTFLFQNLASGDVIQDFTSGVDKIDLSLIDAKSLQAGNESFTFIGSSAFSGKGGEVRVQMDGTTAHILADVNGDNVADLHIVAHNVTQLTANDFNL